MFKREFSKCISSRESFGNQVSGNAIFFRLAKKPLSGNIKILVSWIRDLFFRV
jgi:hypothetical protein